MIINLPTVSKCHRVRSDEMFKNFYYSVNYKIHFVLSDWTRKILLFIDLKKPQKKLAGSDTEIHR